MQLGGNFSRSGAPWFPSSPLDPAAAPALGPAVFT